MKYRHIHQKPGCCVPRCIQMILNRRGLRVIGPQDAIARELGGDPPNRGVLIMLKKYSLSSFFKRQGYELKVRCYLRKHFKTVAQFRNFLKRVLARGDDVLLSFDRGMLIHAPKSFGHAVLVEQVGGTYVLVNEAGRRRKTESVVLLNQLYRAMKSYSHGGVWVISEAQ